MLVSRRVVIWPDPFWTGYVVSAMMRFLKEMIASVDTVSFAGDPTLYIAAWGSQELEGEDQVGRWLGKKKVLGFSNTNSTPTTVTYSFLPVYWMIEFTVNVSFQSWGWKGFFSQVTIVFGPLLVFYVLLLKILSTYWWNIWSMLATRWQLYGSNLLYVK